MSLDDDISKQLQEALGGDYLPAEGGEDIPTTRVLEPLEVCEKPSELRKLEDKSDIVNDYLTVRDTLHTLLNESSKAINGAMALAAETDQPRVYGVVKELLDTTKAIASDIMGLQKTYKEIVNVKPKESDTETPPEEGGEGTSGTVHTTLEEIIAAMKQDKDEE